MPTRDAHISTIAALAAARAAGLEVRADRGRLVVRGPKTAEALVRPLVAQPGAVLALLVAEDAEVAWRVAVMRPQVPARGAIPVLVAQAQDSVPGSCISCGDRLSAGQRHRCGPCGQAAWVVLHEVREGVKA